MDRISHNFRVVMTLVLIGIGLAACGGGAVADFRHIERVTYGP